MTNDARASATPAATQARGRRLTVSLSIKSIVAQTFVQTAGIAILVISLRWLVPYESKNPLSDDTNVPFVIVFSCASLLVWVPASVWLIRKATAWLRAGQEPGRFSRALVIRLATAQTTLLLTLWLLAAILVATTSGDFKSGVTVFLAGLVTCALAFLLLERINRPLVSEALAGRVPGWRRRNLIPRVMLFWFIGSAAPMLWFGLSLLLAEGPLVFSVPRVGLMLISFVMIGGLTMRVAASSIAGPVGRVRIAMDRVSKGDITQRVAVDDRGELGRLAEGFNSMMDGLAEKERISELFSRQVGDEIAAWALEAPEALGGEEREVTVLFIDIDGFTKYAEGHSPDKVVEMLNRFFQVLQDAISRHHGTINKFEGDAALVLFGAPVPNDCHRDDALAVASELPAAFAQHPDLPRSGIGIATGKVLAGKVGSAERYEYTVIGDVVNIAARLCDLAKSSAGGVLATSCSLMGTKWDTNPAPRRTTPPHLSEPGDLTVDAPQAGDGPQVVGNIDQDSWSSLGDISSRGRLQPVAVSEWRPAVAAGPAVASPAASGPQSSRRR